VSIRLREAPTEVDQKFYLWTFPGAPIRIYVRLDVIDSIREQIENQPPGAGAHDSLGLLLGEHAAGIVEISAIDEIWSKAEGEAPGEPTEESKCAKPQANGRVAKTVGFYRATERGIVLSHEDRCLIENPLSEPGLVFLRIDCSERSSLRAGFFFRDRDQQYHGVSFLEFSFDRKLLPASSVPAVKLINESHASAAPGLQNQISGEPASLERSRQLKKPLPLFRGTLYTALAAGLIFGVAFVAVSVWRGGLVWLRPPVPETVSAPRIGLAAQIHAEAVFLQWDQNSSLLAAAKMAMLEVNDGGFTREIPLTRAELQTGNVTYAPISDRVRFRLDVYGDSGKIVTEQAIAVVRPMRIVPEAVAKTSRAVPAAISKPFTAVPRTGRESVDPVLEAPSASIDSRASAISEGRMNPQEGTARVELPPESVQMPVAPLRVAMPPAPLRVTLPPAPLALPAQTARVEVPQQSAPVVPIERPTRVEPIPFIPPEPLRRTDPIVPRSLRTMVLQETIISVRVQIDEQGRVGNTELIGDGGRYPFLITPVLSAAKQWRFKPARQGDRNVGADYVLNFKFTSRR
jgi:hypothetical protein